MVSFRLVENDAIINKPISNINFKKCSVLFCAVERNNNVSIPTGDFVLQSNDKVYVIGDQFNITLFLQYLGNYQERVKNIMIVGGGRISYYLVKLIYKIGVRIKRKVLLKIYIK